MGKHMKAAHPQLWQLFRACRNNSGNYNALLSNINSAVSAVAMKIEKNKKSQIRWPSAITANVDGLVKSNLLLLMWQIANGYGRIGANCPIFDLYLRSLGTNTAANRHTLQDSYLRLLSSLALSEVQKELSECLSVSLSADGWKSRTRQEFVSVSAAWCKILPDNTWKISAANLDILHVPGSCTADALESLISSAVEDFVRAILICFVNIILLV